MFTLSEEISISVIEEEQADGQGDPVSANVDMAGWDGVLLIGLPGAITGAGTATLVATGAATDVAGAALAGASAVATAAAESNKLLLIDIFRPRQRFIGSTLTRAVANSVYNGTLAIRYKAREKPNPTAAAMLADAIVRLVSPALA